MFGLNLAKPNLSQIEWILQCLLRGRSNLNFVKCQISINLLTLFVRYLLLATEGNLSTRSSPSLTDMPSGRLKCSSVSFLRSSRNSCKMKIKDFKTLGTSTSTSFMRLNLFSNLQNRLCSRCQGKYVLLVENPTFTLSPYYESWLCCF